MHIPEPVRRKLQSVPDAPGCYLMRDRRGVIIYVGKAASLRERVRHYFRAATFHRADPKLRGLLRSVADLDFIVARNEAEALLTEGRLIKEYRPRYNVSFRDDKRFLMLRIDPRDPWPMFRAVRLRREDGGVYFGPYASSAATRAAMAFVEKKFGLRRCAPRLPGPEDHRHCINDIVRYCSAPCLGRISREAYLQRVEQACAFLRGELPGCLEELRTAMQAAAAEQDFERAATLRDTLAMLRAIVAQRARTMLTPSLKAEEARVGLVELQRALGLTRWPAVMECYDVSNISGTLAVASMVCAVDGLPQPARYRHFRIRTVQASDDPAMLAEVVRRRFTRLLDEGGTPPDLLIVDGGIAQVNAARRTLGELNLPDLPVAGLAKRLEELYVPGRLAPLRLPRDSAGLRILQRLRDEAHRFALQYHRRLRARRIQSKCRWPDVSRDALRCAGRQGLRPSPRERCRNST